MNLSKSFLLLLSLLFIGVVSCTDEPQEVYRESGLATGEPGMNLYPSDQPGETDPIERPYTNAPPMIPHDVTELEISRAANDCMGCHLDGLEVSEGHAATKIPASHYSNEYTGEQKKATVVGIRYNCLQCHVPQTI
jgi:cytochrome c-type protein NapB